MRLMIAGNTSRRSAGPAGLTWPGMPSSRTSSPRAGWRERLSTTTATLPSLTGTAASSRDGSPGTTSRGRPSDWLPGPPDRDLLNKIFLSSCYYVPPQHREGESVSRDLNLVHWILCNIYEEAELDHIEMITLWLGPVGPNTNNSGVIFMICSSII